MESIDLVIDGDTELICDGESFWVSSALLQARGVWWSPCSLGMDPSASTDSVTVIFPDHTKHELNNFVNKVNGDICSKNSRDVFHGFSANEIPSYRLGIEEDGQCIRVFKEKIPWRPWTSQSSVLSSAVFRRSSTSARGVPSSPRVTSIRQAMYKMSPVRPPLRDRIKLRCQERMRAGRDRIVSAIRNTGDVRDQVRRVVKDFGTLPPQSPGCKGDAFVTFADKNSAETAIQEMNGAALNRQQIKVNEAQPGEVCGVDGDLDHDGYGVGLGGGGDHDHGGGLEGYGSDGGHGDSEGGFLDSATGFLVSGPGDEGHNRDNLKFHADGSGGKVLRYRPVSSEALSSQEVSERELAYMNSIPKDYSEFGGKSVGSVSPARLRLHTAKFHAEERLHELESTVEAGPGGQGGAGGGDTRLEFYEDGGGAVPQYHNSPVSSDGLPSQQVPEMELSYMNSTQEDISEFGGKSVSGLASSLVGGRYQCEVCGKICKNSTELKNHSRSHKFKNCNLCGTQLSANTNLKFHMEMCSKSPTIQCPQCDYKCARPQDLRRHLVRTCKALPHLEHKCNECEFIGKSRGELRQHLKEHPMYGCDRCGRKFRKQSTLNKHVEAHKSNTVTTSAGHFFKIDDSKIDRQKKEKESILFHCLQCSYTSKRKFDLKLHDLRVHQRPKPQKITVKSKCNKGCGFTSLSAWNVRRHQRTCPGPGSGVVTLEKVIELVVDTNCSFTDVRKIRKLLLETYGRGAVEPYVFIKITKLLKDLSVWWTTEVIELQENSKSKKGQLGKTCVSYIKRLKQFEDWVIKLRGIKNPKVVYSFDGGQFKCVGVLNIHDLDRPGEPDIKDHLSTGSRLTLPFLQADMGRRFGENHYNVRKLLSLIEFPESPNFQFSQDYKLKNIILGIIGLNGRHPCAYATCYKVDEDGNPTTRRGLFHKTSVERSQQFQLEWNCKFDDPDDGNGNEAKMGEYYNCHKPPIILQKTNLHRRILLVHPPAPLHDFILGPPNDLVTALVHRYPDIMPVFLEEHDCHPEGAGGKFAGPSMRTILAETNLVELGRRLPDNIGGQVMEYLGSIWRLYCVSMALKLCEHWRNYIADFSAAFLVMYYHEELLKNPPKFQVNCTLKVHCIMDHLGDFFLETGQTLRNVADDFVEVFHQQLRDNEKKHRLRTRRKLGTENHIARLNKSSVIITLKNLGAIPNNIPRYFRQVAAPFPDEMVEEIHRGRGGGGQEDGAAGEEDDENNEPLPSEDAGESVHNDHSYCVSK